ncbi:DUF2062 domain-containing protein [Candidatus Dependentiae bacterium]|nr:DUF2062 domain-containing protein [Candidatus Dependentiae bacterium]
MGFVEKVKSIFRKAIKSNSSPTKLAFSFSIGLFIAFTPLPGAHTLLMLSANWLFGLNFPMLFLATSCNNPWTMIPFYAFDYSFGYWFVHSFLGWSPSWVISLEKIFGSGKICLWSFFVGGHILGIIVAFISYPIMLRVFHRVGR